jgi:hypothetical protein
MKKTVLLLLICFGFAKVKAQTFNNYADTANYLIHEIENKKSLFVNKPLSVLLDSLKIPPVHAIASGVDPSGFGKRVRFFLNLHREFNKTHFMIVKFQAVPAYAQLFPVFYPAVGQLGTIQRIIAVYNTLIVTDVLVKDYTNDEPVNPGAQLSPKKHTDTNNSSRNPEFQPLNKFKGDTVSFINSILANKDYYVNKPLNVLLNDLSIPVKKYTIGNSFKNLNDNPNITLNIYTQIEIEQKLPKRQDPSSLVIVWAKPLSLEASINVGRKSGFVWTPEVADYFGKQIVGDIIKVRYNELK